MLHRPLLTVILGLLFNPLFSESATADARFGVQNCTAEWRFRANQSHIDPFQVDLDVIITDPQQRTERVPAFWAGDLDWKVRYCPHTTGTHQYRTVCSDATDSGLHGQEGKLEVRA